VPEGDTIFLAATRIRAALGGATLARADFRVPRFATVDLAGRVVDEVVSRGKHLLIRVGGGVTIHAHCGMEGVFQIGPRRARWSRPAFRARLVLESATRQVVGFDLRTTEVLATRDEPLRFGHLGPDPLGADWDADEAVRRLLAEPERPIVDALIDQRVLAGLGNVWKCELCFLRGVDPWTPVGAVRDPARLVALVRTLFRANRTTGAHVTTGDVRAGRRHWVYGRGGEPCRRCGTPIAVRGRREPERVTYWCPHCQPPAAIARAG
jgi:formamidopyrimidine-DNA glycosylase